MCENPRLAELLCIAAEELGHTGVCCYRLPGGGVQYEFNEVVLKSVECFVLYEVECGGMMTALAHCACAVASPATFGSAEGLRARSFFR